LSAFFRQKRTLEQYMGYEKDEKIANEKGKEASPTSVGDNAQKRYREDIV